MSILLAIINSLRQMNWFSPWQCVLCRSPALSHYSLCTACENDLPILSRSCDRCARILTSEHFLTCAQCLIFPPPVERTFALFRYEPPITQFITRLKFQQQLIYADLFGNLLVKYLEKKRYQNQISHLPDLILPVPLHIKRLQERGFNQALEISRLFAKKYQIPLDITGISRIRATAAQSHLSAEERKKNMAGAFLAHKRYDGLSIAIVDDVMTTTHTVFELAHLLKRQGAKQVFAFCAARTDYR